MKYLFILLGQLSLFGAVTPEGALDSLKEGNERFTSDQSHHPDRTSERRLETLALQEPFATIVGCSDSRVPPEILFDMGLGDLFIVRVAGNVVGPIELSSVEYSTFFLQSPLIVVLGHENCGAIKAVMNHPPKEFEPITRLIAPAIKNVAKTGEDALENAIKANVRAVVDQLKNYPSLKKQIGLKKLNIIGGYYDFHTGEVEFLK